MNHLDRVLEGPKDVIFLEIFSKNIIYLTQPMSTIKLKRPVYVFGPTNSGSNVIQNSLATNENVQVVRNHTVRRVNPSHWKHNLKEIGKTFQAILRRRDSVIIIAYRNLENWLASVLRTPYFIPLHTKDQKALNQALDFNQVKRVYRYVKQTVPRLHYENLISLYNEFYLTYLGYLQKYQRVVFVDYFKLINQGVSYLNQQLTPVSIRIIPRRFQLVIQKPSKRHGQPVKNRQEAIAKHQKNYTQIEQWIQEDPELKKYLNPKIKEYYEKVKAPTPAPTPTS